MLITLLRISRREANPDFPKLAPLPETVNAQGHLLGAEAQHQGGAIREWCTGSAASIFDD